MFHLYIKTHQTTGLKYFGFTSQDPYSYNGSGIHWKRHLRLHGKNVKTEVYKTCSNIEAVRLWGKKFSEENNIVFDESWANLVEEQGQGGCNHNSETSKKISENHARLSGKENGMFSGYYKTPWGVFESLQAACDAIENKISRVSLHRYCKSNNKMTLKKESLLARGKKHQFFSITDVGKTFDELGFGFFHKLS
jgi:hypothetical protein